jgi:two-component system, NarL family, nitrate/nitrite response regulator NarL
VAVRCLIVDDNEEFLASASRLLESQGVDVAGSASTGEEALRLAGSLMPDVVLVDVELGEEDGVELALKLREAVPSTRVVLISAYERDEIDDLVKPTRAVGFLPKRSLSASAIAELLA